MNGKFHIAIATSDLGKAKEFYGGLLNCPMGRKAPTWVDHDFFGHQLTIQLVTNYVAPKRYYNPQSKVPSNHFGIVLAWKDWHDLKDRLQSAGVTFLVNPKVVFPGKIGEQWSFFIEDPDKRAIEFKSFEDPEELFRTE